MVPDEALGSLLIVKPLLLLKLQKLLNHHVLEGCCTGHKLLDEFGEDIDEKFVTSAAALKNMMVEELL